MNHYQPHTFNVAKPSQHWTKLKSLTSPQWTFLSFLLPFLVCGTIFAAMPIDDVWRHPSGHAIHDTIAAIWVGYSTMGIGSGAAGVSLLYMYRAAKNYLLRKTSSEAST